ncbi:MAG: hypothetical protein P1V97_23545 [Planctomycetota bacterium]|nr:hypothetical protein [Planctomycetota bacterium]
MSYFDYEKISEHLPRDGEAIIVSRKDGELNVRNCPFLPDDLVNDQHSMGRLMIANERISKTSGVLRIPSLILMFCLFGLLVSLGIGWSFWWLYINVFTVIFAAQNWYASARKRKAFRSYALDPVEEVRAKQGVSDPAFLAVLKQMSDFQLIALCYQAHLADHYVDPAEKRSLKQSPKNS